MAVKPIPDGYHTVTPYLIVPGVAKLIDFLKAAFDAKEIHRMATPDGRIMHAEVKIGDSPVMLGEPMGEWKPMPCMMEKRDSYVVTFRENRTATGIVR